MKVTAFDGFDIILTIIMAEVLDSDLEVSEFEIQSRRYIHFLDK